MKKMKSSLVNMVVVLTLITVVAGGALAYVNSMTETKIAEINQQNEDQAKKDVLCTDEIKIASETPVTIEGKEFVVYNAGEKGCAVKAVDPMNASFGGDLTIMVGFDPDGNILGYKILKTQETPGLGAKAGEWFQKDARGSIIGKNPAAGELKVKKDGGDVDAITASTITSRAFLRAVNAAYDAYRQSLGRGPMPQPEAGAQTSEQVNQ
ncbi:MAG: RnfABCDGE type electron transport complex subunit G [Bacteroidales bacterium]|nr:RnfABCDGE type electron transport complex subunit G [Bacteroidales bacterium]